MSERESTLTRLRERAEEEAVLEPGSEEQEPETEEHTEDVGKTPSIREYVILTSSGANSTAWKEEGRVNAGSAESAIRTFATKQVDGAVFVAVPSRNWHPVQVKVETTTAIRLTATPADRK